MALVALGELGLDEGRAGAGDDLLLEALAQLVEQLLLAPQEARLQEAGADGDVGPRQADAVVDRARRLADLEAEVPQLVEHELDDLLAMRRLLVGPQEQEVDIREGRQLAPAVAADGDQAEQLAGARVGDMKHPRRGEVVQRADQLIDQEAGLARHPAAVGRRVVEAAADLRPAGRELALEQRQDRRIAAGIAARLGNRRQRRVEAATVDDGALLADGVHEGAKVPEK